MISIAVGSEDTRAVFCSRGPWRVTALCCAVVALSCATPVIGFRALDADGTTPLPQALAFLPWLLVPAGAALALSAAARWRTGMGWAAVLLAATGWFCKPYGPGSTGAHGPVAAELRVLTSNVEFGGATDALIAAVLRERPDVVFVQECDTHCADTLVDRLPRTRTAMSSRSAARSARRSSAATRCGRPSPSSG